MSLPRVLVATLLLVGGCHRLLPFEPRSFDASLRDSRREEPLGGGDGALERDFLTCDPSKTWCRERVNVDVLLPDLVGAWGDDLNRVYAVGGPYILARGSDAWTVEYNPPGIVLMGVSGTPNEVVAVGHKNPTPGVVLRRTNLGWEVPSVPASVPPLAAVALLVTGTGPEGFAVGGDQVLSLKKNWAAEVSLGEPLKDVGMSLVNAVTVGTNTGVHDKDFVGADTWNALQLPSFLGPVGISYQAVSIDALGTWCAGGKALIGAAAGICCSKTLQCRLFEASTTGASVRDVWLSPNGVVYAIIDNGDTTTTMRKAPVVNPASAAPIFLTDFSTPQNYLNAIHGFLHSPDNTLHLFAVGKQGLILHRVLPNGGL